MTAPPVKRPSMGKMIPWHWTWLPSGRVQIMYRPAKASAPSTPTEPAPAPARKRGVTVEQHQGSLL